MLLRKFRSGYFMGMRKMWFFNGFFNFMFLSAAKIFWTLLFSTGRFNFATISEARNRCLLASSLIILTCRRDILAFLLDFLLDMPYLSPNLRKFLLTFSDLLIFRLIALFERPLSFKILIWHKSTENTFYCFSAVMLLFGRNANWSFYIT